MSEEPILDRKNDHLDIVLDPRRACSKVDPGYAVLTFEHCAVPELRLEDIDIAAALFGRRIAAPLLISSMTGGATRSSNINLNLAEAAEALGIALAVGSQRIALETNADHGLTRQLRDVAPNIPLLANLGAAQLVSGYGIEQAQRAVEMIQADALIIHLNPLQEAVQVGGDRDWRGVLLAIEALALRLQVPLVAKEVGAGISPSVAQRLLDAGVSVIDVAGAGGTSWAAVEAERTADPKQRAIAQAFTGWGIPSAQAIASVRRVCPSATLIASGGIRDGIDAAKAIRLGADLVGQAAGVLDAALVGPQAVIDHFEVLIQQLRVACFCTGSADLAALARAPLLPTFNPNSY